MHSLCKWCAWGHCRVDETFFLKKLFSKKASWTCLARNLGFVTVKTEVKVLIYLFSNSLARFQLFNSWIISNYEMNPEIWIEQQHQSTIFKQTPQTHLRWLLLLCISNGYRRLAEGYLLICDDRQTVEWSHGTIFFNPDLNRCCLGYMFSLHFSGSKFLIN